MTGATVDFTQSGIGAVARQLADKLGDIVSVKDFGAVGDNTHDDTAAIQAAIDSIDTSGGRGGLVYLPIGTYLTSTTISVPARVKLVGAGSRATFINSTHSGSVVRMVDAEYAGVSRMRITVLSTASTAVALEVYSDTLWTQWNTFEELEIICYNAYTRGQKGIWCHSRDNTTTVAYNYWANIRIGAFHKPWVVESYYEGNWHYGMHINGYGLDSGDPGILFTGAACHWECWIGKGASTASSLVGISYAAMPGNNYFRVTADIGTGYAVKLISGTIPTDSNVNIYAVTCTQGVTALGDVIGFANAANDAAAATAGVALGQMYRNGSVLMIRVA